MSDLTPGTEFAGCRIETIRGRGGMGVVYRARQLSLDRPVAIKLINEAQAGDAQAHRRFEREARLMASIDHPNVVPLYAAGEEDGQLYLVMRYVDGTDLQARLGAEGKLSASEAARITDQVGRALDSAHQKGLVHRDIKPSNVLLSGTHVYLTDFGITRLADQRTSSTEAGTWIGTFDYISPEQLRGESSGPRSDVYSLGCLLYACLVGTPPFHRETTAATITAQLHAEPPRASNVPGVPKQFDEVIRTALAKRPKDRYSSAGQLGMAALAAADGRRNRVWRPAPRSRPAESVGRAAPAPPATDTPQHESTGATELSQATVVQNDVETRLAPTTAMPRAVDPTRRMPRVAWSVELGSWRRSPAAIGAMVALSLLIVAAAVGTFVLRDESDPAATGPLTAAQVATAARQFATDYSKRDSRSLARLLASNVTRVDPLSTEHGRAGVLREYHEQFVTNPMPTRYVLSNLRVLPGWAGRVEGQYTLTVAGGATLFGRVVFGLQRSGDRTQIALISTR